MNWRLWIILGWLAFNACYTLSLVGRRRPPKTATEAACAVFECAVIAYLVVTL